jgi:hypothetical protein
MTELYGVVVSIPDSSVEFLLSWTVNFEGNTGILCKVQISSSFIDLPCPSYITIPVFEVI